MLLLYSWLKDFIETDLTPDELAGKFTALGIQIEGMKKTGAEFSGVCVAEILKIDKHPNADKLSLVEVDTGAGTQTVVCGAKNIAAGQKIPLAQVGAKLPGGTLKKSKIRGVESCGMICSSSELNITGGPENGIMVLDANLAKGTDVATLFGEPDCIFDLEITPNRPELLSVLGIARELSVLLGKPLKKPQVTAPKGAGPCAPVTISAPDACPRYTARTLKNLENRQSPPWMQARLKAMNTNPKNALIDITNYVLYETGHPLHAFDLDKLAGPEIIVRKANPAEKITTLDGRENTLDEKCLVIADAGKPAAMAGVMGGMDSSVSESTKNILLESAYFAPPVIHITARKYGYRSESSYRFERSTDIENTIYASNRATDLILAACSTPQTEVSELRDVYPVPYVPAEVSVTPGDINAILGTDIPDDEILRILRALSPGMEAAALPWRFKAPSHRRDIKMKCDLAEEVAMYAGYDRISDAPRPAFVSVTEMPAEQALSEQLKNKLAAAGFCEVYNYDFISAKELRTFCINPETTPEIENPLSEDWQYLRPSLLPGIARSAAYNVNQSGQASWLFETGKVYEKTPGKPNEKLYLSALMTGTYPQGVFWRSGEIKELDFFHVKGIVDSLLARVENVRIVPCSEAPAYAHPKICADITVNGKPAGRLGKLYPDTARAASLFSANAWLFELDIDALAKHGAGQEMKVTTAPAFPSSWRDLSVVLEKNALFADIENTVKAAGGPHLESVSLFDLYEGKGIDENRKSVTMRLVYRSGERTLRDTEVEESFNTIVKTLSEKLGASLRS
ncbi:MAG: phenylalanine--tRNA ligase subunit beta [Elusimicrobiaceae bacterium]